uniref:Complex 1 LYR protein domain-containing protein n=1 Tax=Eptatretus burgeri TaxID=7764 RepID=A0A8C4X1L9_EPTBU
MVRHSELQRQVLSLYRQLMRASQGKPGFVPFVRSEFRRQATLSRLDVQRIHFLLRRGRRQLFQLQEMYKALSPAAPHS